VTYVSYQYFVEKNAATCHLMRLSTQKFREAYVCLEEWNVF